MAYLSLIISIPWLVAAQTDSPHRLEPEKTIERTLTGGSSDSYTLDLHLGDLVALKITDKGQDVILSVFGPAGDLNRAFSSEGMGGGTIRFFAVRAGSWRVRVAARSKDTPATYVISDLKISSPLHVAPPPDPNESARIKGLRTGADVAAFWKEIGPEGSPPNRLRTIQNTGWSRSCGVVAMTRRECSCSTNRASPRLPTPA
jgi:hypothetical protein